ncbi:iron-sulfur-binding ferredoxin reductase [Pseudomonas alkylphenolica]|uniref:Iron-sulfur-binding ferredoxin reductase n=1 Tax=Pseudomonas alkylphenolica TaxID=237609 RepID=A0A443ZS81_9PSED|nr:iron-sulfur-binding ferredoxin reductase [Pseudomonas alkylphenolica]RWU22287.1 iron-sulfur-binding ferredoxin reductase [Pseudomonas alkylphenolica]
MPDIRVGERCWSVAAGSNLLDALNEAGLTVPYSCRAGSCHACMVRCLDGQLQDARPEALESARRQQGWRLSCQCRVESDVQVALFDPMQDGAGASVVGVDWLSQTVLRLRLEPERLLRYQAGQHLVLWSVNGVARPYSLASVPGEDRCLEFHLDCRQPGAFCEAARQLRVGDMLRLGELRGGALHYDADWQERPLWLLAAGTGLAPLWGILREALRQEHHGPIRLLHLAHDDTEHYLAKALMTLAEGHPQLQVELLTPQTLPQSLAALRLQARQTITLACGSPASVEQFSRRMFLAGLPRNQLFADTFVGHA